MIDIEDIRKDVKPLSNVESELGGVESIMASVFYKQDRLRQARI